jgi:hypothetical protein
VIINPYVFAAAAAAYTWSTTDKSSLLTLSGGDLTVTHDGSNARGLVRAATGVSTGKWYWEIVDPAAMPNTYEISAITKSTVATNVQPGSSADGYEYNGINGHLYHSGDAGAWGATYGVSDVIGIAFDVDAGKLWFAKNNSWQASGDPGAGTNPAFSSIAAGTWYPTSSIYDASGALVAHFKTADLTYSPPSGFSAIGG